MPAYVIDVTGQKFGRLTVIEFAGLDKNRASTWKCRCDCGTERVFRGDRLRYGKTSSCGCLKKELDAQWGRDNTKHGMCYSRIYHTWQAMRTRCKWTGSARDRINYYGRGIRVCDDWNSSFESFRDWSLSNGYQDDLSIDRINNDGNYEPSNCRWATCKEQQSNTSYNRMVTLDGQTMTIAESARKQGIPYSTLCNRERKKRLANA